VNNRIPDNSRLSPTENSKSEHVQSKRPIYTRHDTDRTILSCLVWRCELSRPDGRTSAFSDGVCRAAQCDRRTHSDADARVCPSRCNRTHLKQASFIKFHHNRSDGCGDVAIKRFVAMLYFRNSNIITVKSPISHHLATYREDRSLWPASYFS